MKRFFGCLQVDVSMQVKYGLYSVYSVITLLFILLLKQLPESWREIALPLIIFSDPSILGFYFISGLLFLEKNDGILEYFITTPLRTKEYLLSKVISLAMLSLMTSIIICIFSGSEVRYINVIAGILLTSIWFTLVGFIAASKTSSVSQFLVTSLLYTLVLYLPLLDYFGLFRSPLFYLMPTYASILLINSGFTPITAWKLLYSLCYLTAAILITFRIAYKAFVKFIVQKGGVNA